MASLFISSSSFVKLLLEEEERTKWRKREKRDNLITLSKEIDREKCKKYLHQDKMEDEDGNGTFLWPATLTSTLCGTEGQETENLREMVMGGS